LVSGVRETTRDVNRHAVPTIGFVAKRAVVPFAFAAVVAGCGGAPRTVPSGDAAALSATSGVVSRPAAAATPFAPRGIYVTEAHGLMGKLPLDDAGGAPLCTISNLAYPGDPAVDWDRTVYVPVREGSVVAAYDPDCTLDTARSLQDPGESPVDVAFAPDGTAYVDNVVTTSVGAGSISVYPPGATTPSRLLTDPLINDSYGVLVDARGNVFESFQYSGDGVHAFLETPGILEYAGGEGAAKILSLSGLHGPVGLQMDDHATLIVVDAVLRRVLRYAYPYRGAPVSSFSLVGRAYYAKLDRLSQRLYVANIDDGTIDVYAYPSGTLQYRLDRGLTASNEVWGVALDPPNQNS
jgi:hypothetical protein